MSKCAKKKSDLVIVLQDFDVVLLGRLGFQVALAGLERVFDGAEAVVRRNLHLGQIGLPRPPINRSEISDA